MGERSRLIQSALIDAIGWQDSLAEAYAHVPGAPEAKQALALARKYRALLKTISGSSKTPMEATVSEMKSLTLMEIIGQSLSPKEPRHEG